MKPSRFGKYTLLDKLGRGRVADAYLALVDEPVSLAGDLVVVKRLRSSRTHADELRSQDVPMPAEAALACELHHPNIVATYEVSEVDEMPYWAIEHLHGKPLDEVLAAAARSGGLPIQLGLWIAAGVLRALHYAHTWKDRTGAPQPIAHGDVNAHNVFICYSGEFRLLDFCMARRVVKRDATSQEREDLFRAPETELGLHDVRADIYSAGCLLKVLAAAHLDTGSLDAWIQVEAPIRAVCERAMRADPSERHPSAEAMLREVEALLSNIVAFQALPEMTDQLGAYMQRAFVVERDDAETRIALLRAAVSRPKPDNDSGAIDAASSKPDETRTIEEDVEAIEHAAPLSTSVSQRPPPLPKTVATRTSAPTPSNDDKGTGYALLAVLLAIMMLIATRLP